MATDATGTPTTKFGIRKYNTSADAPSGLGFNGAMDDIDTLFSTLGIASLAANDVPVWDSVAGKFKKATGAHDGTKFLRDDGTWVVPATAVIPPGFEIAVVEQTTTTTTTSTTLVDLVTFPAATFENVKYYFEMVLSNVRHSVALASAIFQLMEGAATVGNPAQFEMAGTASNGVVCVLRIPFTPTAAAHTYKVQWKTAVAGTLTLVATSLAAGEFRIVKA